MNGVIHGTMIYYDDGSKREETPYVDGKRHGTRIWYHEEGSKAEETVFENGERISYKRWDGDGKQTHPKP